MWYSCVSEMSVRRNETVQRTRGGDRESPWERVRIVWSEELPREAGPQDKQGLNSSVPPGSPFHVVRQKACAGCWRLRLGTQDHS